MGIGASAGGLEALQQLFDKLPPDTDLAFVVVQHLSPDFKSLMDEILRRHTAMAVHRVTDGMKVEANSVYSIPPKMEMIVSDGKLLLTEKDDSQTLSLPIDHFFRSLAQEAGLQSVAIVLSGTGSDGSRGIRDVHAAGGLVIAQDTESAKFDGMPKSAVETDVVDLVLSPAEMAEALLRYADHPLQQPKESTLVEEHGLKRILNQLRDAHNLDFSLYKPATVMRRIERRLLLKHIDSVEEYCRQLEGDPAELNQLYCDLLIGVTRFFRDREAFHYLEHEILPDLIAKVPENEEVRMWVAGCATGEEAYSLALLVHEQMTAMGRKPNAKIFATDVHRGSLETAGAGKYKFMSLSELSPERLDRYFKPTTDGFFRVEKELRNLIVFASHNVIQDAPFTRLHLMTCRNLMIYFQPPAQKKVLSLFHFGLKTGGTLLLGPSESVGELADEFETVQQHWKFFRKRRDISLSSEIRFPLGVSGMPDRVVGSDRVMIQRSGVDKQLLGIYDAALRDYMPPGVLLDRRGALLHAFRGAGQFLRVPDGRPTAGILDQLPVEVRTTAVGLLQRPNVNPIVFRHISLGDDKDSLLMEVTVRSLQLPDSDEPHVLITFAETPRLDGEEQSGEAVREEQMQTDDVLRLRERNDALESELRFTRENLQATVEELETSNEELQATNEELVASNEEMQSTNEELHSVNEELYTVNAEHQKHIEKLTELTADINGLMESTQVHTIFLDRDLRIRKFTPQIAESFALEPHDVGRRIHSFTSSIQHADMIADIEAVLDKGEIVEQEVPDQSGRWFLLRILPYRKEDEIDGVVLTLIDITVLKDAEFRFSGAVDACPEAMLVVESDGTIALVNGEVERRFGYSRDELVGQPIEFLIPTELRSDHVQLRRDYFQCPHVIQRMSGTYVLGQRKDGTRLSLDVRINPIVTRSGTKAIASLIDMTDHQKLEHSLREDVVQRDRFLATLSHELRNPLGALMNAAQLLSHEDQENPANSGEADAGYARRVISQQSRHMARLLDDLLDVSRVTAGKIEMRLERFDLRDICDESIDVSRPLIVLHEHELTTDISPTPLWINGDRARLLQVLENLINNAAKYSPDGGQISLTMLAENEEAVLRVQDDGKGISKQLLDSIFDMFVQSDETLDRSEGGMGLGLTLVRSLVQLHDGAITVHSDGPGTGSVFEVRLPLVEAPERMSAQSDPTETADERQDESLRLVLVEDQKANRELLSKLLKADGFQVDVAADGRSGLDLILQQRPDIAIIDIGLPELNGYEVAKQVRRELGSNTIRMVALTGYGQSDDRRRVLEAGFDEHVVKPIKVEELGSILRTKPGARSS